MCLGRVPMRARGEGEYESYDGSRSPHTSRWRCARVAPSRATEIIHAVTINANTKIMRIVVRSRQETRPLDVKMASYHRSYQLRFNHLRSCTSASAYIATTSNVIRKTRAHFFLVLEYDAARTLRRPEPYTRWTWLACVRMAGRRPSRSARTRNDSASSSSICGTLVRSVSWPTLRYFR
jgi:hypothetical protein